MHNCKRKVCRLSLTVNDSPGSSLRGYLACSLRHIKDPVYTVRDPYGHDIKLNDFKTSVAFKFMLMLQKLLKNNHRKNG